MEEMTGLVTSNHDLVYNALSFATATLGIAFVYFLVSRNRISPAYRSAVTMSAMICGIAAYHYWRMFSNFSAGTWNEGYRYADWLLTVPLLVAELVVVSGVSKAVAKKVTPRLIVGALLMIATEEQMRGRNLSWYFRQTHHVVIRRAFLLHFSCQVIPLFVEPIQPIRQVQVHRPAIYIQKRVFANQLLLFF